MPQTAATANKTTAKSFVYKYTENTDQKTKELQPTTS
jgi:hypothetical protein